MESEQANASDTNGQKELHGLGLGQQQGKKPKMELSTDVDSSHQDRVRSPLKPRNGSPLVLVQSESGGGRARQPSEGVQGVRKASVGGMKRMVYTEEDLEVMDVEERAIALACGLKDEVRLPTLLFSSS